MECNYSEMEWCCFLQKGHKGDHQSRLLETGRIEAECPHCGALNDITEYNDYELVPCWSCNKESEVSNGTLIDIDEDVMRE